MPNWTHCELTINAPKNILSAIKQLLSNDQAECDAQSVLDFSKVVPEPSYTNDTDWYKWRIINWGTKWNACFVELKQSTGPLVYEFATAWSIPRPVLLKLSEMYPSATMRLNVLDEEDEREYTLTFRNGGVD